MDPIREVQAQGGEMIIAAGNLTQNQLACYLN